MNDGPVIIWDVDDVLNALMRHWFEGHWMKAHPGCRLKYTGLKQNPPHRLLGVKKQEYLASLDDFRLSGAYAGLSPSREVMDWFRAFGCRFRHMALTATPVRSAPVSAEWVLRHFGRWIRSFCFVPSARQGESLPAYDRKKEDFLAWLGKGDILVDDNKENVQAARALGIRTVLISQPWNSGRQTLAESLRLLAALAPCPA